jgi:hypothetical protein
VKCVLFLLDLGGEFDLFTLFDFNYAFWFL